MKKREFTPGALERYLGDLRGVPDQESGPHATDNELLGYARESLPHEDWQRVDRHLASCEACCDDLDEVLAAVATEAPVLDQLKDLVAARWTALSSAFSLPAFDLRLQPAFAGANHGQRLDVAWRHTVTDDGSLVISVGISGEGLQGARVTLKRDDFERTFALRPVGGDEIGAEVRISKDEWQKLGAGPLLAEVELADGSVIRAPLPDES
jgi:hypothetical protein